MTTLLILAHIARPEPFADALARRPDAAAIELRPLVVNGLSSAYHALAASLRARAPDGRLLPALLRHVRASRPVTGYDRILLVSWSAPYALAQELLSREDDAAALAGWVALDSGYGDVTAGEVALALRARAGGAVLWAGATDVPTTGYASSRAHLAELCRRAGEPTGGFHVELWEHDSAALHAAADKGAFWREEHVGALLRGPAFVARALAALDRLADAQRPTDPPDTLPTGAAPRRDTKALQDALNAAGARPSLAVDGIIGPKTQAALRAFQRAHGLPETGAPDEATWAVLTATEEPAGRPPLSVGLLALERLRGEVGVHETPGPAFTPRVVEYGSGAIRDGKRLDLGQTDEPAWCAALQGWAERDLPGALPWRWSVAERWADAKARGLTRPKTYRARAGDEAIFARGGGDPRYGGTGHDARVERDVDDAGSFATIGGNEGGAAHHGGEVMLTEHNVSDPSLVGWIVRT